MASTLQDLIRNETGNDSFSLPWAGEDPASSVLNANFPFPAVTAEIDVPLLVMTGDGVDFAYDENGEQWTLGNPGEEYEALIFMHGIGGDRTAALGFGSQLIDAYDGQKDGVVVFAIDQPLHGIDPEGTSFPGADISATFENVGLNPQGGATERHFGFGGSVLNIQAMNFEEEGDNNGVSSGDLFINPLNFSKNLDNLRQGALDLLNLRASIETIEGISGDSVHFAGHSLGTVNGASFVAAAMSSGRDDLFLRSTHLLTPASGVVRLIENSPELSGDILGQLSAFNLSQGESNYEDFLRVLQHSIDSTDPINFAHELGVSRTLITQVNDDQVTPNAADLLWSFTDGPPSGPLGGAFPAPLSGSEPLAFYLGDGELAGPETDTDQLGGADTVSSAPAITRYDAAEASHGTPVAGPLLGSGPAFEQMIRQTLDLMAIED